jgi:predicted SAM-dependent methyltransferase
MTAKKPVLYYPLENDDGWNYEVNKLVPWLFGKMVDVGAGGRSIKPTDTRVDIDPALEPDVVASGDKLPFKDGEYDSLYAIHTIEHLKDTRAALKEWLRILSPIGIVALVVPDRFFTGTKYEHRPVGDQSQFMAHLHEWTQKEFLDEIKTYQDLGFEIVDSGEALRDWSFFVILKKNLALRKNEQKTAG